jgi:hypothetical protein
MGRRQAPRGLGWGVALLDVCVVFSILRTLEYLNAPVWVWITRLARAAAAFVGLS